MALNITTKKGDSGTTKTFVGETISKGDSSVLLLAYGDLTNSYLGSCKVDTTDIQRMIQKTMGFISYITNIDTDNRNKIVNNMISMSNILFISSSDIEYIEEICSKYRVLANELDIRMSGWHSYKGSNEMLASKTLRLFETLFVKFMESRFYFIAEILSEENAKVLNLDNFYIFLNRMSDLLFYMGLIEEHVNDEYKNKMNIELYVDDIKEKNKNSS